LGLGGALLLLKEGEFRGGISMVKKQDIKFVKDFKKRLSKNLPLKKLILFGSRATGKTHKWSDFDILIVSPEFKEKYSSKDVQICETFGDMNSQ